MACNLKSFVKIIFVTEKVNWPSGDDFDWLNNFKHRDYYL